MALTTDGERRTVNGPSAPGISGQAVGRQPSAVAVWRRFFISFLKTPETRAVGLVFTVLSWCFASWLVHIPHVKTTLGLSDGELGWVLFGLPIGHLFINPIAGRLVNRFGAVNICLVTATLTALTMWLPVFAPNVWLLVASLAVFGGILALLDIAANACAAELSIHGHSVFATCHGMWSVGGVAASLFAGGFLAAGFSEKTHILVASALVLGLIWLISSDLKKVPIRPPDENSSGFAPASRRLVLLIGLGMLMLLAEGLAFDWSGVFLRDCRGATAAEAAFGFSMFTIGMTVGRFGGDLLISRFGERRLLPICALVGAGGLCLAVFFENYWAGLSGFLMLGLGCSLGAPMLFGLSMRLPGVTPAAGLATFATFSFLAFLGGPPFLGFISDWIGLPSGLLIVAGGLLVAAFFSRKI